MNRHIASLVAVLLISFLTVSCSGSGSPVSPSGQQEPSQDLTAGADRAAQDGPVLWGYYDFFLDIENRKIEAVPNRSVGFSANVVKFLNNDPAGLQVKFNGTSPGTGYIDIDMDITIKHPLSDHAYDGYDVRGIFVGNGSANLACIADLIYPVDGTDQMLLNADGYSRWFNPTEFLVPTIFGYIPGKLASKGYTGTATLSPYKYFGEHLGATDNLWDYLSSGNANVGYFLAGTSDTRNYINRFPIPLPGVKYGYAVVANWSGTKPEFHPSHAPEAVGVKVEDSSDVWYVDDSNNGGDLILDITVFDWDAELTGGVMEDYSIFIESTVLSSVHELDTAEMTPTSSGDHWYTYHVEIAADTVTGTEGNEMWVVIEDANADYTNPLGVPNSADGDKVSACFRYPLTVLNEEPSWIHVTSPNGGEEWEVGSSQEITWEADPDIQNMAIGLSLNSGANFTYLVAASTPNDGVFTWNPIPYEAYGALDRIKIKDVDNSAVYDVSDADFAVTGTWLVVTCPNGGEVFVAGTDEEITWKSSETSGVVTIDYSKDNFAADVHSIAVDTPNDGSFFWEDIPWDLSDTVRVRVHCAAPEMSDTSDGDFSIVEPEPYIEVLVPNGGEAWGFGQSHEITWDSYEVTGTVNIWYSKDDFESDIHTIATGEPNDYSYEWENIPVDQSDSVRVKIGSTLNPSIYDVSDDYFSMEEGGWARTWGSTPDDEAHATVADADGNVYVTGVQNVSGTDFAVFLCLYSVNGELLWKRTWGGVGYTMGSGIAVEEGDPDYVYLAGTFEGTDIDFDPGSGTDLHSSNGVRDAFLCKFDSSGTFVWAVTWGGNGNDQSQGVALTGSGSVYVTGSFWASVDFNPDPSGADLHSSNGALDVFLTRFSDSGTHSWAGTWGESSWDQGWSVAVDASGRAIVFGNFSGVDVDFDPDPLDFTLSSSNGGTDMFISWFNKFNDFQGVLTWGGPFSDYTYGMDIDGLGNILVTGSFNGTDVDFDPGGGTDLHSSSDSYDVCVSKFDSLFSFQWARTWGGTTVDFGYAVVGDGSGNVYVTGLFGGSDVDFDPGPETDLRSSNGLNDLYLSFFTPSGSYMTAYTWGGQWTDEGYGLSLSNDGRLYVCGTFSATGVEFAPVDSPCHEESCILDSNGGYDPFLVKYMPDGCW